MGPDESDSTNPIIVIKYLASPVLKSTYFMTSVILLLSGIRETYNTFFSKSNLLLFQCLLIGANCCTENAHKMLRYWSPQFQGSMGPKSLGWASLRVSNFEHLLQYVAQALCGKNVGNCPRPVLDLFLFFLLQNLTPLVSHSLCWIFIV